MSPDLASSSPIQQHQDSSPEKQKDTSPWRWGPEPYPIWTDDPLVLPSWKRLESEALPLRQESCLNILTPTKQTLYFVRKMLHSGVTCECVDRKMNVSHRDARILTILVRLWIRGVLLLTGCSMVSLDCRTMWFWKSKFVSEGPASWRYSGSCILWQALYATLWQCL